MNFAYSGNEMACVDERIRTQSPSVLSEVTNFGSTGMSFLRRMLEWHQSRTPSDAGLDFAPRPENENLVRRGLFSASAPHVACGGAGHVGVHGPVTVVGTVDDRVAVVVVDHVGELADDPHQRPHLNAGFSDIVAGAKGHDRVNDRVLAVADRDATGVVAAFVAQVARGERSYAQRQAGATPGALTAIGDYAEDADRLVPPLFREALGLHRIELLGTLRGGLFFVERRVRRRVSVGACPATGHSQK